MFLYLNNIVISDKITINVLASVELFRHGARAPIVKFTENKDLYFGSKRTQLTINGFRQHLLLGRWVRRRYISGDIHTLLKDDLVSKQIKVYSSPRQRTIFSASSHILGLIPNSLIKINFEGNQKLKTTDLPPIDKFHLRSKNLREVTINVIDPQKDTLFHGINCRRRNHNTSFKKEQYNYHNSKNKFFIINPGELKNSIDDILSNYGNHFKGNLPFENQENKYTEKTLGKLIDFLDQYKYHNMNDLNLDKETIVVMKKGALNYYYVPRLDGLNVNKFRVSKMFQIISQFFQEVILGKTETKLLIFSGHDDNITNFISVLFDKEFLKSKIFKSIEKQEEFDFLIPELASSILIELIEHIDSKRHYIRLLYNGEEIISNFSSPLKLVEEVRLINYEDFLHLLRNNIDDDIDKLDCSYSKE